MESRLAQRLLLAPGMRPDHRELLADLFALNKPLIWADVLLTGAVGWGAIACGAAGLGGAAGTFAAWAVAALAIFRASVFLHDLVHLGDAVPGIRLAWNVFWGVPFLLPSYLYERIHLEHHRLSVYGQPDGDPEYTALARHGVRATVVMSVVGLFLPVALVLRFLVVTPLSPFFRRFVDERLNSLASNARYRAKPLTGRKRRVALVSELATSAWAWAVVGLLALGVLPARAVAFHLVVLFSAVAANQVRSLTVHRWATVGVEDDEDVLNDSINLVPRSWLLRALIPVSTRMHALHHLAPAVPYHHLEAAHRRMLAHEGPGSPYARATSPGVFACVRDLVADARRRAAPSPRAGDAQVPAQEARVR